MNNSNKNKSTKRSNKTILGIILILFGIAGFVLGFHQYNKAQVPTSYVKTNGTVTRIISKVNSTNAGGETDYYPVISYQGQNGGTYSFTGSVGYTNPSSYVKGETIAIAYSPNNPSDSARLDTPDALKNKNIDVIEFGVLGGIFIVVGVVIVLTNKKTP